MSLIPFTRFKSGASNIEIRSLPNLLIATLATLPSTSLIPVSSVLSQVFHWLLVVIGRPVVEALADLVLACTTGREQF